MKKDLGAQTLMFPMPVLIIATYNQDGSANAMNAAWGGIHDTNQIGICIAPEQNCRKYFAKKSFYSKHGRRSSCYSM